MAQKANTVGGGARTNLNGLHFEQTSELKEVFNKREDFCVLGDDVYRKGIKIGTLYQKHGLYKNLLEPNGINYKLYISKKLLPDDAILIYGINTLFIIEKKFQSSAGSVDEKLQTCDFKKKQYTKLLQPLGITVKYCYFLSDWFQKDEYKDVKNYIMEGGCQYFFDEIPLEYFGIE